MKLNNAFFGNGVRPSDKDFFAISKHQYSKKGVDPIKNYKLVYDSDTVKAYLDESDDTIILSVRGTTSKEDVKADASIAVNRLKYSTRYARDKQIIEQIATMFPYDKYDYYLTGHSLGGALINQLKRDFKWLKDSVQFNPAFQPYDLISQQSNENKRYYTPDDPLYNFGGRLFSGNIMVKTEKPTLKMPSNILSDSFNYYQGHSLDNFDNVLGSGYVMNIGDFIKKIKGTGINKMKIINKLGDLNVADLKTIAKKISNIHKIALTKIKKNELLDSLNKVVDLDGGNIMLKSELIDGGKFSKTQGFMRKMIAKNFINENTPMNAYAEFDITKMRKTPSNYLKTKQTIRKNTQPTVRNKYQNKVQKLLEKTRKQDKESSAYRKASKIATQQAKEKVAELQRMMIKRNQPVEVEYEEESEIEDSETEPKKPKQQKEPKQPKQPKQQKESGIVMKIGATYKDGTMEMLPFFQDYQISGNPTKLQRINEIATTIYNDMGDKKVNTYAISPLSLKYSTETQLKKDLFEFNKMASGNQLIDKAFMRDTFDISRLIKDGYFILYVFEKDRDKKQLIFRSVAIMTKPTTEQLISGRRDNQLEIKYLGGSKYTFNVFSYIQNVIENEGGKNDFVNWSKIDILFLKALTLYNTLNFYNRQGLGATDDEIEEQKDEIYGNIQLLFKRDNALFIRIGDELKNKDDTELGNIYDKKLRKGGLLELFLFFNTKNSQSTKKVFIKDKNENKELIGPTPKKWVKESYDKFNETIAPTLTTTKGGSDIKMTIGAAYEDGRTEIIPFFKPGEFLPVKVKRIDDVAKFIYDDMGNEKVKTYAFTIREKITSRSSQLKKNLFEFTKEVPANYRIGKSFSRGNFDINDRMDGSQIVQYTFEKDTTNKQLIFRSMALLTVRGERRDLGLKPNDDFIEIDYLAGSKYSYNNFKYIQNVIENEGGKNEFVDFRKVLFIELSALTLFNTLNFYNKQGLKSTIKESDRMKEKVYNNLKIHFKNYNIIFRELGESIKENNKKEIEESYDNYLDPGTLLELYLFFETTASQKMKKVLIKKINNDKPLIGPDPEQWTIEAYNRVKAEHPKGPKEPKQPK